MSKSCPKCGRAMEQGFVVDTGHYDSPKVAAWHAGAPDRRWWGLKVRKDRKLPLVSYRCTGCGLLENYAQ